MLPLLPLLAAGALGFTPESFHLMKVKEVYAGSEAAPNAQYVMIQMYAAGQNQVQNKQIVVYGRDGAVVQTFTFPGPVAGFADQSTILIATPEAQTFFAPGGPLVADLAMAPVLRPWAARCASTTPSSAWAISTARRGAASRATPPAWGLRSTSRWACSAGWPCAAAWTSAACPPTWTAATTPTTAPTTSSPWCRPRATTPAWAASCRPRSAATASCSRWSSATTTT